MSAIEARFLRGMRATPKRDPDQAVGLAYPDGKISRKTDVGMYRHWAANSEFIRMANDIRLGQLSSADWDIVPADPKKPYPKRLQRRLRELFQEPNPVDEGWEPFIKRVGEDILNLDAGAIELERTFRREIAMMWPVDGGRVGVNKYWDGELLEARYYWLAQNGYEVIDKYSDDEMLYVMQRPATHRAIGLSNLEVLKRSIDGELRGSDYNARQVTTAGGDGIFDLGENARPEQVEKFQRYWLAEVAGRGSVAFWAARRGPSGSRSATTTATCSSWSCRSTSSRRSAAVFGLFPGDLGFGESTSTRPPRRSRTSRPRTAAAAPAGWCRPLHARGRLGRPFGGRDNNLAFRFTA